MPEITIVKEDAMDLKEHREECMGEFEGKEGKGEML